MQEQVLDIKNNYAAKYDLEKMDKPLFWVKYLSLLAQRSRPSIETVFTFFKHLFVRKGVFSRCSNKNEVQKQGYIASDLRCALTSNELRTENVVKNTQAHLSH